MAAACAVCSCSCLYCLACVAGVSLEWDVPPSHASPARAGEAGGRVPLERVRLRHDVPNEVGHLLVLPAEPCGSRSLVRGAGLTLASAGLETSFRILSRDAYENSNIDSLDPQVPLASSTLRPRARRGRDRPTDREREGERQRQRERESARARARERETD